MTIRYPSPQAKRPALLLAKEGVDMDMSDVLHSLSNTISAFVFGALLAVCSPAHADGLTVTTITYDPGDNAATVTDPRGLVTSYTHDGLGQLWQQVSPDTGTTTYGYDSYGRRSSTTRADGTQTTYGYDGLNRMTSVSTGGQTQNFTYDTCTHGVGRLCSDSDATGATSYSYTPEGWIAGRGFSMGGTTYAIGYSHDAMGHLSTVNYPDGNQANYAYVEGVVSGVSLTVGGSVVSGASAIIYRPGDLAMAAWTSSNGLSNTLGYDDDGRLTAIWVPGVQTLGFTYDNADRITQIANGIDTALTQNFGYDDQSRLVSVYASADNESFQYDANGNRLMQTGTVDSVSATSNQLVSSGGTAYGYDALGNTTTVNGAATYHYDAFHRMDSAGGTAYYVNPEGQRLRKAGTAGTSYFAPDRGGALLAEYLNGGWIDYVWLNGRLIGRMAGGQVDAIHDDQLGRPEVVTAANQSVVWRAQNLAFTRNVTVANITLNLGFPGQYYDAETGNWNNGFRDYDSLHGRYVESDPIGLGGGVNTYAYVGNDPITGIDPLGLYCLKEWQIRGIAGAAVGAAIGGFAGSESGPGALLTAGAGAVINGGLGVVDGLLSTSQANGAALGAAGVMAGGGTKMDLPGGVYGGAVGGAVSSELENEGYPRPVAVGAGGLTGGSLGAVITGYLKGLNPSAILKGGLKGGGIGVAAGVVQTGLEAAIRAGNDCGCSK